MHNLLDELDDAAVAAGQECYCGRSPDICEDAGGCPASQEIGRLRDALRRHQHKLTDSRGDCCAGCLSNWPCPEGAGMAADGVIFRRGPAQAHAECDGGCSFYLGDGTNAQVRRAARKHVRTTSHPVYVTVEQSTRYETQVREQLEADRG